MDLAVGEWLDVGIAVLQPAPAFPVSGRKGGPGGRIGIFLTFLSLLCVLRKIPGNVRVFRPVAVLGLAALPGGFRIDHMGCGPGDSGLDLLRCGDWAAGEPVGRKWYGGLAEQGFTGRIRGNGGGPAVSYGWYFGRIWPACHGAQRLLLIGGWRLVLSGWYRKLFGDDFALGLHRSCPDGFRGRFRGGRGSTPRGDF